MLQAQRNQFLPRFSLLISILILSCNQYSNSVGNRKGGTDSVGSKVNKTLDQSKRNFDTLMRSKIYVFLADTILHDKLLDTNNMGKFDIYKYKNDTIVQLAYVHYISEKKMIYLLTSYNRASEKYCQVYDTAICPVENNTDNAASYEDETLDGTSYGAYEYFTEHNGMETTIGVEPSRGKRLSVYSTLNEHCDPSIPINSVGTLRMIKKSNIPQKAHGIPKE